jgi:hypothetical protein
MAHARSSCTRRRIPSPGLRAAAQKASDPAAGRRSGRLVVDRRVWPLDAKPVRRSGRDIGAGLAGSHALPPSWTFRICRCCRNGRPSFVWLTTLVPDEHAESRTRCTNRAAAAGSVLLPSLGALPMSSLG